MTWPSNRATCSSFASLAVALATASAAPSSVAPTSLAPFSRTLDWRVPASLARGSLALLSFASARAQDADKPTKSTDKPGSTVQVDAAGSKVQVDPTRGLKLRSPGTFDGYTLLSPLRSRTTFLVDMDGQVVHRWTTQHAPGNADHLLPNGHLLRLARLEDNPTFHGGGIGGRVQEFDWDGNVVWDFTVSTPDRQHHHDFEPLPNGNVLLIIWELRTRDEAIARGRDPGEVGEEGLWPDGVLEIEPVRPDGGKVVWEWHVWDHIVQDRDPSKPAYGKIADHPELVDVNAGRREHDRRAETDEQRKKREETAARMRALGYAGGDPDDGADGADGANARRAEPAKEKPAGGAADSAKDKPPVAGADSANGKAGDKGNTGDARKVEPANPTKDKPVTAPPGDAGGGPGDGPRGPEPDWLHTNSVDYDPENDLVLLSTPRLSEIWIIDHSTTSAQAASHSGGRRGRGGDLLYRWGNPKSHGAGTDADRRLFAQHDARFVPKGLPGAGHVTIFNNGEGRPGGDMSSVDEIALPFDPTTGFASVVTSSASPARDASGVTDPARGASGAPDPAQDAGAASDAGRAAGAAPDPARASSIAFGPKAPVWSYSAKDSFFSGFISGAHRLPNGNTLVCSGADGRIFEVTRDAEIVWEYQNPFGGEVEPSFGRGGRRGGPGGGPPGAGGPPGGGRPDGAPPRDGPPGDGAAPNGPPGGGPPGAGAAGDPGRGGRGPGGSVKPVALFRATRIAPDHPGLAGRKL